MQHKGNNLRVVCKVLLQPEHTQQHHLHQQPAQTPRLAGEESAGVPAQPQTGWRQSWEAAAHPAQWPRGTEVQATPSPAKWCKSLCNTAEELQAVCAHCCVQWNHHQSTRTFQILRYRMHYFFVGPDACFTNAFV